MTTSNDHYWENYSLRHHFAEKVGPDGLFDGNGRVFVICRDCFQTRWVYQDRDQHGFYFVDKDVYGCAIIPFWYRFKMFLLRRDIPLWSVNSMPPWIRKETA